MTELPRPIRVFACTTALGRLRAPVAEDELGLTRLLCVGRVNAGMILKAFEDGAERVLVLGCDEPGCRHENGPGLAIEQVGLAQELLRTLGLGPNRVNLELVDRDGCSAPALPPAPGDQ